MIVAYHKIENNQIGDVTNQYFVERIAQYCKKEDKLRTYTSYVLLKELAKKYGYNLDTLKIVRDKNGKPCIKNNEFWFNISHSEDMVAVAIDKKPIGIDIEQIRPLNLHVAKKFFSDKIEKINSSTNPDLEFTKQWTIFEGKLKYYGNIALLRQNPQLKTKSIDIFDEKTNKQYVLTVATNQNIDNLKIEKV